MPTSAFAAGSVLPARAQSAQFVYAYVNVGEMLVAGGSIGAVVAPDGTAAAGAGTYGPALTAGVWRAQLPTIGASTDGYDWTLNVHSHAHVVIPGRVWSESYGMQQLAPDLLDLTFWAVNNTGYVYQIGLDGYNGINSRIEANSVGWADADCAPTYRSFEYSASSESVVAQPPLPDCGETYRIFFEAPAADLPETSISVEGEELVLPETLDETGVDIDDLTFTADYFSAAAGTFTYSINPRFIGGYLLQIDVDADGAYDGAHDRSIQLGADGTGSYSYEFDGLDAQGEAIPDCRLMNARIFFDKLGEVHIVQTDVERRSGISVQRLNGPSLPDSTIFWDDRGFTGTQATTTPTVTNLGGVASAAGVHGWEFDVNSWGNNRIMDDWAFVPADFGVGEISIGGRCLDVTKSSTFTNDSRPGDTITYSVTATNTGTADFTDDVPAVIFDDFSAATDDATYNEDATATLTSGQTPAPVTYTAPSHLSWTGPLEVGDTVTLEYTMTLQAGGDGSLRNVAWQPTSVPPDRELPPTPPCGDAAGGDLETGEPCATVNNDLPRLTLTKQADVQEIPAHGDTVTYTVVATNVGPGTFTATAPASVVDDLSEVLDDAEFGEILEPSTGASFDAPGETVNWAGPLADGASITIRYTVVYDAFTGDGVLRNVACVPESDTDPDSESCASVRIPAAQLDLEKEVSPSDGTALGAGDLLTYTLTFSSVGEAAAEVDHLDDLSGVLDDADFNEGSIVVSDPAAVSAVRTGNDLDITGSIEPGDVVTVTYEVTVKTFAEQGDHVLENSLGFGDRSCPPSGCEETSNPIRHFTTTKSATPTEGVLTGDVVEYTLTVTNDGSVDYTEANPAGLTDDLTDVLDDASYDAITVAESSDGKVVPAPEFDSPLLTWAGPVAVGETVTITYSVTVTNLGDHDLVNTATPVCAEGQACDPPTPPVTVLLPSITPSKDADPASGEGLVAGDTVTYTLVWSNSGQASGPVESTDDLSGVLDDADMSEEPVVDPAHAATVTAEFSAAQEEIRVIGSLAAGETLTVIYQVTVKPDGSRGDNVLGNVLVPDVPPFAPPTDCEVDCPPPFEPPTTEHPIAELRTWKSVDPASGSTVRPGTTVTYTLHFDSSGTAPVTVAIHDVVSGVLDDADLTSEPASPDGLDVSNVTDGRFTVSGTLAAGASATVVYVVTVKGEGERGDDRLSNFLVPEGEEPPQSCEDGSGEYPTCTVNYVSNVVVVKSSNPASGASVRVGQVIVYTLTFSNLSDDVEAAPASLDYTDDLSDVLDDARLTTGPESSRSSVTAPLGSASISILGTLTSGATAKVTYSVTVKPYAEQGDHLLANVVGVTGVESVCVTGNGLCTEHRVPSPPLPRTGVDIGVLAFIAVLTAVGGLGLVLVVDRRRRRLENR